MEGKGRGGERGLDRQGRRVDTAEKLSDCLRFDKSAKPSLSLSSYRVTRLLLNVSAEWGHVLPLRDGICGFTYTMLATEACHTVPLR